MINAYSEMREKVARELMAREWDSPTWENAPTEGVREMFRLTADASIPAVIKALIEMDLPDDAINEAKSVPSVERDWRANYTNEFRAILTALKPLLTKEDAQS